jgi:hypothetical protein
MEGRRFILYEATRTFLYKFHYYKIVIVKLSLQVQVTIPPTEG